MSLNCPTCGVALELAVVRPRKEGVPEWLRRQVFERDGWQCVKCGSAENLAADHIIPEMYGGEATLENLQTLCRSCNSSKGASLPPPEIPEPQVAAQPVPQPSRVGGVSSKRLRYQYDDKGFQQFWQVYPRRVGKASAFSRWKAVVREVDPAVVIAAATQYAEECRNLEAQYIKYPEGWLSAGRWDDEAPTPPKANGSALVVGSPEWVALNRPWEVSVD